MECPPRVYVIEITDDGIQHLPPGAGYAPRLYFDQAYTPPGAGTAATLVELRPSLGVKSVSMIVDRNTAVIMGAHLPVIESDGTIAVRTPAPLGNSILLVWEKPR